MELSEQFNAASERVNHLPSRPSNDDLLALYGLYKQATEGDVTGERPGGFDFKAIAKYDAWKEVQGLSSEEAMQRYIALVDRLEQEA
ncbi:Acyl-CoA-binding protein [Catalinimonas alkaloidigena]|uniref:Acyl-CoA-binding protein n=1 Tax=Catalinimonas alkaloidigena TaxID=1075417 RepID=A0A1G8XT40_9BACT|nr:acyl-CoA-binding protein [Catalinimonas alkaloidigena]SDJ93657.1 Acyl-CoA-binding protein [Catalinimonas alkaloidigena]